MRHVFANLVLWAVAVVAALVMVGDSPRFTFFAPVMAICMIGSALVVRSAAKK